MSSTTTAPHDQDDDDSNRRRAAAVLCVLSSCVHNSNTSLKSRETRVRFEYYVHITCAIYTVFHMLRRVIAVCIIFRYDFGVYYEQVINDVHNAR